MRGRSEHHGRVTRTVYHKETGTFVSEEEPHPFLLRLAETQAINGANVPVPLPTKPESLPEKGKHK
jgi:hypothetical protein